MSFDPAAETSADGRPSLQVRLGLWGRVVTFVNGVYWAAWWLTYVGPDGDQRATWQLVPAIGVLCAVYAGLWIVGHLRPLPLPVLKLIDVVAFALIGATFFAGLLVHPVPAMIAIEALTATTFITFVRALLVPSTGRRTLIVSAIMVTPPLVAAFVLRGRLAPPGVSPGSYFTTFATWSVFCCGSCTVASRILYGLRREAHDARRLGQYTILEELGRGGMGVVYRASHAMLRRPTAIKLLSPDGRSEAAERFEQEVQLMARMSHPNIVTVHDYGQTSMGTFYYAMELLDGLDLDRLVQRHGPPPPERAVHVLRQVALALGHAHSQGLVHRDVKPANIFLCRSFGQPDAVKVLDFGLVRNLHGSGPELTGDTQLLGTPLYMAPEATTDPPLVDSRTDLYALGAVAYFLLSGKPVFGGFSWIEVAAQHLYKLPKPLSEQTQVSAELERVVLRCLEKSPAQRFADANELERALGACPEACRWTLADAERWWKENEANPVRATEPSSALLDRIEVAGHRARRYSRLARFDHDLSALDSRSARRL